MLPQQSVNSANSCGCGAPIKCNACVYKLICERSPFCCVCKGNGNCDLTPVLTAIQQLGNTLSGLNANIESIGAFLNTMNSSLNSIGMMTNTINSKLDEVLSRLPTTTSATSNNTIGFNVSNDKRIVKNNVENDVNNPISVETAQSSQIPNQNESGMVPYSAVQNEDSTVLVQKKGLFGKTKWVEDLAPMLRK